MKKIGVLHGKERSFPEAFVQRVNGKNIEGIIAEPVKIDKVMQGESSGYAVILDRISQDVPFYRAFLKNAAISGTAVINNPFWWSADEKFFNNALATKIGVPVPKTVILPSRDLPADTSEDSFSNLAYPLDWEGIFHYVGFPAYMKPFAGGGWKNVYKLRSMDDFFENCSQSAPYKFEGIESNKIVVSSYCLLPASSQVEGLQYLFERLVTSEYAGAGLMFLFCEAIAMAEIIACPALLCGKEIIILPPVMVVFTVFFKAPFVPAAFHISIFCKTVLLLIATSNNRMPLPFIPPPIPIQGSIK